MAGAEAALVTYTDAAQGFTIARPAPWTQDKSVTQGVKFNGSTDSLTLQIVTLAAGTTALAYAQGNVAAVASAFTGFKQLNLAPSTEVPNAIVLAFTANGTSGVTGKTYTAQGDRYYMPVSGGRIAILTIVGPVQNYDREGIRDIALTFKLTK